MLDDIFNKKDFIHELDCAGDDDDVYWHFPYSYTALNLSSIGAYVTDVFRNGQFVGTITQNESGDVIGQSGDTGVYGKYGGDF